MASTISGQVYNLKGWAVAGAMISLRDENGARMTVYSDKRGRFRLETEFVGALVLRARAPYLRDISHMLTLAPGASRDLRLIFSPLASAEARSDTLTASAHAMKLNWHSAGRKKTFVSQCHYCHQMGNELTRQPRDEAQWGEVIARMEGYFTLVTPWDKREFNEVLARDFDGLPAERASKPYPLYQLEDEAMERRARASWTEWRIGDGQSFIHDTDIGHDGHLYGVDQGHDVVWELDPVSGKITRHQMPDIDLPKGGHFAGAQLPIGIFTGKHGPHSLAEDERGRFWITGSLSSTLLSFDTKNKTFETFEIGGDALYPHTIRRAQTGLFWFTLPASNQVGRFDPATKQFTLIQLPSNGFFRWLSDALFPTILKIASWFPEQNTHLWMSSHWWSGLGRDILNFPYGIDVHPQTGAIWYSKLYAGKIGRIDPKTLEVTEFDTPLSGPRRLRFDKNGILWIPSFDEGALMRFDPLNETFTTTRLPELAPGEYEVPYALNIHPKTGDVWITTNQSDRILRFEPATGRFTAYPSPTRVTFLRDLVFDKRGRVCASNSNLPAYAIEGGQPVMFCLDPGGNVGQTKSSARIATRD